MDLFANKKNNYVCSGAESLKHRTPKWHFLAKLVLLDTSDRGENRTHGLRELSLLISKAWSMNFPVTPHFSPPWRAEPHQILYSE